MAYKSGRGCGRDEGGIRRDRRAACTFTVLSHQHAMSSGRVVMIVSITVQRVLLLVINRQSPGPVNLP